MNLETARFIDVQIDLCLSLPHVPGFPDIIMGPRYDEVNTYQKLLLAFVGPSGSGKTTLAENFSKALTATTRKKSKERGEKNNAYIWLPDTIDVPNTNKTLRLGDAEFLQALKMIYGLAEATTCGKNIYGTPIQSILKAITEGDGVGAVALDTTGALNLEPILKPQAIKVVTLGMVPDNAYVLWSNTSDRNDREKRFKLAAIEMARMSKDCHLFVHNSMQERKALGLEIKSYVNSTLIEPSAHI